MHIVVTGAAGYLGSVVVGRLLMRGHSVTAVDRLLYGGRALAPWLSNPAFKLVVADVRAPEVQALMRGQSVVHLAAYVGEDACLLRADCDEVNAIAAMQVAGLARHVVFTSTCSNYGVQSPEHMATEDTPLNPQGVYARSKVQAEEYVKAAGGHHAVLRLGTLCGPSSRMRFDLLVNDMVQAAYTGRDLELYAPQAWRPWLHVEDAAAAVVAACLYQLGGTWNVVAENLQKCDLAKVLEVAVPGYRCKINVNGAKPDPRDYRVDGSRFALRCQTTWAPRYTVFNAMQQVHTLCRLLGHVAPLNSQEFSNA